MAVERGYRILEMRFKNPSQSFAIVRSRKAYYYANTQLG
jgi:hypothetical protein